MSRIIYHLCRAEDWRAATAAGQYPGSDQDRADGFIHFSTGTQVRDSAARHHPGAEGLLLLAVSVAALGEALRWEPSRQGQLFPHLYGPLPVTAVMEVHDLPLSPDGYHRFPLLED